jgi:hypothetical protein
LKCVGSCQDRAAIVTFPDGQHIQVRGAFNAESPHSELSTRCPLLPAST